MAATIDDFDFLMPESELVFYDDEHGFCINTQDALDKEEIIHDIGTEVYDWMLLMIDQLKCDE